MRSPACSCNAEPPVATKPALEIHPRPHALLRTLPSLATTEKPFVREESPYVETPAEVQGVQPIAPPLLPLLMDSQRIGREVKCRSPCPRPHDSQSTLPQAAARRHSEQAIARSQAPMPAPVWTALAVPDADFHSRPPPGRRHRSVCAAPFDSSDRPQSAGQSLMPLSSSPQRIVVMLNLSQSVILMNHLASHNN
jgi:hypothetical protein